MKLGWKVHILYGKFTSPLPPQINVMVPWKYVTGCRTWTAVQVNSVPLATSASGTDTSYLPRGSCGGDKDNYMMAHQ